MSHVTCVAPAQETGTAVPASPWPAARCRRAGSPPGHGARTDEEVGRRQYGAGLQGTKVTSELGFHPGALLLPTNPADIC